MAKIHYAGLPTEKNNSKTRRIGQATIQEALSLISQEDARVPKAVFAKKKQISSGVSLIVSSLKQGGRLVFMGAGTSGRLGVLEAAECPPTFGTPPSLVQAVMAGGKSAVFKSKEGAEDNGKEAAAWVRKKLSPQDVLVGIAASGVTAFVREGIKAARRKKAKTILITCHSKTPKYLANVVIAVNTGPEVIAGSTRLKAGSATKLVLNALTVASMIQMGKVFGNRMVDLQPKSKKLVERGVHLISTVGKVPPKTARSLFYKSHKKVKAALLMARKKIGYREAERLLKNHKGHLHKILPYHGE